MFAVCWEFLLWHATQRVRWMRGRTGPGERGCRNSLDLSQLPASRSKRAERNRPQPSVELPASCRGTSMERPTTDYCATLGNKTCPGLECGPRGSRRRQVTGRNLFKTTCEEQVFRKYEYCSATSTPFLWGSGSGTYPENRHDFVKAERAAIRRIYFNLAFRTGAS